MHFEHHREIAAPASTVWRLTTDIERWPAIMPTVTRVERLDDGPLQPGSTARLKQPAQRPTVWTVSIVEPERRFVWEAKVSGVRCVATHEIAPTPDGCRNSLILDFSGRGARLLGRVMGGRLRKVLATENECFDRAATAA